MSLPPNDDVTVTGRGGSTAGRGDLEGGTSTGGGNGPDTGDPGAGQAGKGGSGASDGASSNGGASGSIGAGGSQDDGGSAGGTDEGSTGGGDGPTSGNGGSSGSDGSAVAGSSGSGGSSGASGGGGVSGSDGSGGSPRPDAGTDGSHEGGGTGGIAGASGAGGSGGTAADAATPDAATTGLSIRYAARNTQATSAYLQAELHADNTGTSSVPVSQLKVRYYFTDEVRKTPQLTINWSHLCVPGNCSSTLVVTFTVNALTPAVTGADTYLEFGFSSNHPTLDPGESADFAFQMQGPNPAVDIYTQTNDYSFDSSKTTPSNWQRVVLLQNNAVLWGTPP